MRVLRARFDFIDESKALLTGNLKEDLPNPDLLPDMEAAVKRIETALEKGELIFIHGDYDADGFTATALLVEGLREMGGKVEYFILHRATDGYGSATQGTK